MRAAGWSVCGRLAASPFTGSRLEDAAGYLDAGELLDDDRIDLAVVDGSVPDLAALLPVLRAEALLVLLEAPAPLDVEVLQAARAVDGPPAVVALLQRWEGWARTVRAAIGLAGPPLQVTVRGWPRGAAAAAELVDLVGLWCGEVAAVAAAPGPLPADALPGGERVAWALLAASGATVLVSHEGEGGGQLVRVSSAGARVEAGPDGARWVGGEPLPLLRLPEDVPPAPRGVPPGMVATAAALTGAVGGGDVRPLGPRNGTEPGPATLGDLLVSARVLAALRDSARTERLVAVS